MQKYRNKKTVVDGIEFQSCKEAKRWSELRILERAGEIQHLSRQVKFVLIPTQREPGTIGKRGGVKPGKVIEKECAYFADFFYTENGVPVVEDAKGYRTEVFKIKKKLMLHVHGIRVREI